MAVRYHCNRRSPFTRFIPVRKGKKREDLRFSSSSRLLGGGEWILRIPRSEASIMNLTLRSWTTRSYP